jgi:hypothetical protein
LSAIFSGANSMCCVPANVQHRTGIHQLQHLVAELVAHHVPVKLERLYERRNPESISITPAPARPLMRIKMGLQPVRLPADFKPLKTHAPAEAQPLAQLQVYRRPPRHRSANSQTAPPAALALGAHANHVAVPGDAAARAQFVFRGAQIGCRPLQWSLPLLRAKLFLSCRM